MGWEAILIQFLIELGIETGPSLSKLIGQAISEFLDDVREGAYDKTVEDYAFLIAAGVIAGNPTMRPGLQAALVADSIRILLLNPNVKRWATPMSVATLTALALSKAGFTTEVTV